MFGLTVIVSSVFEIETMCSKTENCEHDVAFFWSGKMHYVLVSPMHLKNISQQEHYHSR